MLVQASGRGQIRFEHFSAALAPLQEAWWADVGRRPLPWYAEEKLRSGAFSTLLALSLRERRHDRQITWSALAVGDTCLFIVRDRELITSFPVHASEAFDNSPLLISSIPARNRALDAALHRDSGLAQDGDRFYLATDALASWFLARHEEDAEPWNVLDDLVTDDAQGRFAEWIETERREHRIRNDDVTLLRFSLE